MPAAYAWPTLAKKGGDELFDHYHHTQKKLGSEKSLLGLIFNKSQKQVSGPGQDVVCMPAID